MTRTALVALLLLAGGAVAVLLMGDHIEEHESQGVVVPDAGDDSQVAPELSGLHGRGPSPESTSGPRDDQTEPHRPEDWCITASVIDDKDATPIPGATITAWMQIAGNRTHLARGKTLADGSLRIDLARLAHVSKTQLGRVQLIGYASAPGHYGSRGAPRSVDALLTEDLRPTDWSMEFKLTKSAVLRGQILAPDGTPLRHVGIIAIRRKPKRTSQKTPEAERPPREVVFTDDEGLYAVPAPAPGEYIVVARRRDIIRKLSSPITSDGVSDVVVPPLTVEWLLVKTGFVRFEDGTPVADLSFSMTHRHYQGHFSASDWLPPYSPVRVRTDGLGQFKVALPQVPEYWPRTGGGFEVSIPGLRSRETGLEAEAAAFDMTLPAHRLRLRLRDANAKPLGGQEVSLRLGRRGDVEGTTDGQGEVSFFVAKGATGSLCVLRTGSSLFTMPIEVPTVGNESVVLVNVPDCAAVGWVRFSLHAPTDSSLYPIEATIRTRDGLEVVKQRLYSAGDRIPLACGPYQVSLWSSSKHSFGDDVPIMYSQRKLPDLVWIRKGETTVVDAPWPDTAGLALRIAADGVEPGKLLKSVIHLESATGERMSAHLRRRPPGNSRVGEWVYSLMRRPPGRYTLIIEAEGCRTVAHEFSLHHDELTKIEVQVEREP